MDIYWEDRVDWEPLTLTLSGAGLRIRDAEVFTRRWLIEREHRKLCNCEEKSLRIRRGRSSKSVMVTCEWMCERCLSDYCKRLEAQFPSITRVNIGLAQSVVPNQPADGPAIVHVAGKTVLFEDGQEYEVPAFQIARVPVSLVDFVQFVEATGYRTTAEQLGDRDTFRANQAMSPFKREGEIAAVTCVSFYDAVEYCRWREGVRLPTEQEWVSAAIVDERIYDRWLDREVLRDSQGRLRQMSLPNALQSLGVEWTGSQLENDRAVVRLGPQWIRYVDWQKNPPRRVMAKVDYDLFTTFRVVFTESAKA